MNSRFLALALLASTVAAAPAAAVTSVGSVAVSIVGTSANADAISTGTTFTNTDFSIADSATGDFLPVVGEFLFLSPLIAEIGQAFSFTSTFGDFAGTVEATSAQGGSDNRTVSAFVLGNFMPMGSMGAFSEGPASATFSFTQTGVGNAVSGSFTLASPPAGGVVPEPAAWIMLIAGFGLVGAAARRRRGETSVQH